MSKPSLPQFRMPAVWIAAIALIAIAVAGLAVKFSAPTAKDAGLLKPTSYKAETPTLNAEQRGRIHASLAALPLAFEANQGQTDPQVRYTARGNGYSVFLTSNDTVFAISSAKRPVAQPLRTTATRRGPHTAEKIQNASIDMRLVGGNSKPEIIAGNELPGIVNYYIGNDPKNWHAGVKRYSSVSYREVYPGVNMVFHGAQRQLEFDFAVSPGADPKAIALGFKGARRLDTDASGNLVLASSAGDVVLHKPVAYQERDGKREVVEAEFQVNGNEVALNLGAYDRGRELVIDPTLTYATYLGGSLEDDALAVAVDNVGNAYVTGQTNSPTFGGMTNTTSNFAVFVTEVNAAGSALVYTAIFAATGSGSGSCAGTAIAVDGTGEAFVGGSATVGFPTTVGAFQTSFGGGTGTTMLDGFVMKLAASTGAPAYSTYLGGSGNDVVNGIAIDSTKNAYVTGETSSTNFPGASSSTIQSANAGGDDAFVTEMNSAGTALVYSTYLGGSNADLGTGIALDGSGNAYVTGITISTNFPTTSLVFQKTAGGGDDSFVAEVKSGGSTLVYSTYLGGSGSDDSLGIAVDSSGDAYVTGDTNSINFPTANAVQSSLGGNSATNAFLAKLNPGATALLFSTYYGGAQDDTATGIALDQFGDAYITGKATSPTYPVLNSFQSTLSGTADAFVTEFSNTGFVVYSSFYGGTGVENSFPASSPLGGIAVDTNGNAYLVGNTASSTTLPTVNPLQPSYGGGPADGFVAKVGPAPADFSVAVSPSSTSVASGSTTSPITVTVSSVNSSYGQAVNLSCSGLPSKAVCHFTNASVTPGSSPATSTLTIATNGASSSKIQLRSGSRRKQMVAALFLPIFGITLLGAATSRRRARLYGLLVLGLVLAGLILLPACGGSSYGGGGGGTCAAAPSVPTGLAASSTTSTGTTLNWTASTVGAYCSVSSYTIYQNGTQIGTSPTPTFNVTGLAAATTYSFTVSATDSAGASAQSSPLSVTTGTAPGTYTITVTGTGASSVSHSTQVTLTVN